MALDLSSLRKAVASLERALRVAASPGPGAPDADRAEVIRAGVIQNFEFTYELCWKFMRRWLEINVGGPNIDGATRKELFRMAAENKLISDVERWFQYHSARNDTVHTYDSAKASQIYSISTPFAADAKTFLQELERRND